MKPIVFSVFLLASVFAHAQDSLRLLSRFEQFYTKKNVLKKIESARVGMVGNTEITLQKVSNPGGNSRMAVVLSQARTSSVVPLASFALYIDQDELDGLCKALKFFLDESKKKEAPKNDPYYMYTTNNNVVVSLVYLNSESSVPGWHIVVSQRYTDSGSTIPASVVTVKTNEIEGFVFAFNNANRIEDL